MLVIGAEELGEPLAESFNCPHCGEQHEIIYGEEVMPDGSKRPTRLLSFYRCGEKTYLAGIEGRKLK